MQDSKPYIIDHLQGATWDNVVLYIATAILLMVGLAGVTGTLGMVASREEEMQCRSCRGERPKREEEDEEEKEPTVYKQFQLAFQ